jgi:hypothetical protein
MSEKPGIRVIVTGRHNNIAGKALRDPALEPDTNIRVEGRSGSTGSEETNVKLSLDRALAVMESFEAHGVEGGQDDREGLRRGPARGVERHARRPGQEPPRPDRRPR